MHCPPENAQSAGTDASADGWASLLHVRGRGTVAAGQRISVLARSASEWRFRNEVGLDIWLRAELLRRGRRDQWARHECEHGADWDLVRRIDAANTTWLAGVIADRGWPGHELVGADGAHAAWLLAQHARPELQACWLDLLRAAVDSGDARRRDLAFLEDRVRVHQGLPQHYGTQWGGPAGTAARLFPLADPEQVNHRRAVLGLTAIAEQHLHDAWDRTELDDRPASPAPNSELPDHTRRSAPNLASE